MRNVLRRQSSINLLVLLNIVHVCAHMHALIQLYKYVSHIYTYLLNYYLISSAILLPADENFDKIDSVFQEYLFIIYLLRSFLMTTFLLYYSIEIKLMCIYLVIGI